MTVSTIGSIAEFVTNGVTTNYPFYFKFLASEDLVVTYVDPDGISSVLTLGTHYTANGAGNDHGGSVVTTSALSGPGQLIVSREMDPFQQTSLRNQGKFLAETHEDVFDRLTMLIQQGFAIFTRALTRPFGRDYFFAENRRITAVKDPVDMQDAATKRWSLTYIADLISGITGNPNLASNVFYLGPDGLPYFVQDLAGAGPLNGISLVKGGFRVAGTIAEALSLTPAKAGAIYIMETAVGTGGGGHYYIDPTDTTTPVNGGTVFAMPGGGRLKLVNANAVATVHHFGAFGNGSTNDQAAVQACTNWAMTWNGVVRCPGNNYVVGTGITVQSNTFRTIKFQGSGTGDAQTASSGGTTFVSFGTSTAITAIFNVFANENILIEGINFYSTGQSQTSGGCAVKLIRGPANSRYLSGFRFVDVGILGYAVGFWWQGMNTVASGNNYFGSINYQNVTITSTGIGHLQQNCSLNLLSFLSTVMLGCKFGAVVCQRDGDVGAGNGLGSLIFATISNKSHLEGCGGMFRTDPTVVLDLGVPVRSSITAIDLTHENCGAEINGSGVALGDPWCLGVNTDVHIVGNVVDGISNAEQVLPYLNSTARLWCDSRMRVVVNGGKIMTPNTVNAPSIRKVSPKKVGAVNGVATIIVPLAESTTYAIKSKVIIGGGAGGFIESMHYGVYGSAPNRIQVAGAVIADNLTFNWGADPASGAIQLTVTNTGTMLDWPIDLTVENLSSATITIPSEY